MSNTALEKSHEETRLNVRFAGPLADHIERRVKSQVYNTSSEYLRDLVRRDMEAEQLANLRTAEDDIANGRTTPLGTKAEFMAELKANYLASKKREA